jgi:hypothetical protein
MPIRKLHCFPLLCLPFKECSGIALRGIGTCQCGPRVENLGRANGSCIALEGAHAPRLSSCLISTQIRNKIDNFPFRK